MSPRLHAHVLFVCERPVSDPVVETVSRELGQVLVRASTGDEGLALARDTDFALVLIGYAGDDEALIATIRRMRAIPRARHTPLVVLGVPPGPDFALEAVYEAGAIAAIAEPVSPTILKAKARFYLDAFASVHERLRAEAALRESEERYHTLFDSLDDGVCVLEVLFDDDDTACNLHILEVNPAFVVQTGLSDVVGKTAAEIAPANERYWYELYGHVVQTGEPVRATYESKALGRWFDLYAARIGPREARRVAVLFSDISARRRAEEELRRLAADLAEADRLKTEFLATLAHELRNPLAPIRSGLQLMRRSGNDLATVGRVQDIMDRQLDHLVHLVDDLLDVARITRGQVELKRSWVDLAQLVAGAVEISRPLVDAARHQLDVRLPEAPVRLFADPTRITQVISNLLNNAARYTPRGGRIVLSATREAGLVSIRVADNGVGIARSALPEVFKMFTQAGSGEHAHGGLGIGLSLVRTFVELHGGTVRADSDGPGSGAVFTVTLPLHAEDEPAVPGPRSVVDSSAAQPLRLLVVDDNRDAAETLGALLDVMGNATAIANDGPQALRLMRSFEPQVVFLDIGMPGMSGYEVAEAIRRERAFDAVLLVALTGWGGELDRARSASAGFDEHLTKPATIDAIETVLARVAATA